MWAHVAGNARVDSDKQSQSITILSSVSVLMSVASWEQDHMSSGVYALGRVAGDEGGA
jgi:hypothetical protein